MAFSTIGMVSAALAVAAAAGVGEGQRLMSLQDLVVALRQGGYVLVMRHASSPREPPSKETANADNIDRQRQLDAAGRSGATAMGQALRDLKIPIGEVLTSPTYRARETVSLARLANPTIVDELGDGGQSMQGVTEAQAAWLRGQVTRAPKTANTVIVTHMPNLVRAFADWGSTVSDGETVIIHPDGTGMMIVGRIKIEEWSQLH
jgi:phosphohistidine phosphatase SixA